MSAVLFLEKNLSAADDIKKQSFEALKTDYMMGKKRRKCDDERWVRLKAVRDRL
jgi:hypothetical protein